MNIYTSTVEARASLPPPFARNACFFRRDEHRSSIFFLPWVLSVNTCIWMVNYTPRFAASIGDASNHARVYHWFCSFNLGLLHYSIRRVELQITVVTRAFLHGIPSSIRIPIPHTLEICPGPWLAVPSIVSLINNVSREALQSRKNYRLDIDWHVNVDALLFAPNLFSWTRLWDATFLNGAKNNSDTSFASPPNCFTWNVHKTAIDDLDKAINFYKFKWGTRQSSLTYLAKTTAAIRPTCIQLRM